MSKLFISAAIGVMAGVIDVVPMIAQKIDRYACASAFLQWVVLGVLISYVQIPLAPWLKGLIVAEMAALPILALVAKAEPRSTVPIVIMSAGTLVGIATAKFA